MPNNAEDDRRIVTQAYLDKELNALKYELLLHINAIEVKTLKTHDFVFGNGKIGVDERLRIIDAWILSQKEISDRRRAWWDRFQWVIIPIVIGLIVAFASQAFYFWTKTVPMLEHLIELEKLVY